MTTYAALTLEEIADVLSNTKTRGEYKPVISRFNDSGELAVDLSEKFPGKVAASLRNSINVNIEKNFTGDAYNLKTVLVGEKGSEHVLLINMTVYAEQQAAAQEENENEQ